MPKIITLLIIIFLTIISPKIIFASIPPVLISPPNNSYTNDASPKLSWEASGGCPSKASCYKVEVSTDQTFSNLEKSTYLNNTSYSPQLSPGTWFWRVKAKDENDEWSPYSQPQVFAIVSSTNSPTPTSASSNSPSPSTDSTNKDEPLFVIISEKYSLTGDESTLVTVAIKNLTPNSTYYIKAAFYKEGSTNYFGWTEVNGNWVKNSVSFDSQFKVEANSEGSWHGTINVKNDPSDSGFTNSGEYKLKVGRYNEKGSGLTWSNSLNIKLNAEKPTTNSNNADQGDTPLKTPTSQTSPTPKTASQNTQSSSTELTSASDINYQLPNLSPDVLGTATESSETAIVAGTKSFNWWFIASGLTLLVAAASYLAYQRKIR